MRSRYWPKHVTSLPKMQYLWPEKKNSPFSEEVSCFFWVWDVWDFLPFSRSVGWDVVWLDDGEQNRGKDSFSIHFWGTSIIVLRSFPLFGGEIYRRVMWAHFHTYVHRLRRICSMMIIHWFDQIWRCSSFKIVPTSETFQEWFPYPIQAWKMPIHWRLTVCCKSVPNQNVMSTPRLEQSNWWGGLINPIWVFPKIVVPPNHPF